MSYIDMIHLFMGICIGLIFGLWGGRAIVVQTTGDMTIGDIVNKICEAI